MPEPNVFNYAAHTQAEFDGLLDFVRDQGYAVVGPLKCRMKQSTQTNREDQPGRSLQPTERINEHANRCQA